MEDFLAAVLSKSADTVGHFGAVTPKSFLCSQNFVVFKNLFQTYDKN